MTDPKNKQKSSDKDQKHAGESRDVREGSQDMNDQNKESRNRPNQDMQSREKQHEDMKDREAKNNPQRQQPTMKEGKDMPEKAARKGADIENPDLPGPEKTVEPDDNPDETKRKIPNINK